MFDQRDQTQSGLDRLAPRVGPFEAVRRHKLLALLPVIVALALAGAYGAKRPPVYTAEARQTIGRIDVSAPGALAGFQSATTALASSYSRAIVAPKVVVPAAQATGVSPGYVRDHLTASPIPESSVIAVKATGSSEQRSIALASAGARALEQFVAKLNATNPNANRLLREFRRASGKRERLRGELAQLRRSAGAKPSAAVRRRLADLSERADAAELSAAAVSENYAISRRSESNVSILQTISVPQVAKTDQFSRLQIVLFAALAGGVLLGIGLASLRSNLEVRRALAVR